MANYIKKADKLNYNYDYIREIIKEWLKKRGNTKLKLREQLYGEAKFDENGNLKDNKYRRVMDFANGKKNNFKAEEILKLCDILNGDLEKALGIDDTRYEELLKEFENLYTSMQGSGTVIDKELCREYIKRKYDMWSAYVKEHSYAREHSDVKREVGKVVYGTAGSNTMDIIVWCCKKINNDIDERIKKLGVNDKGKKEELEKMKISYRIALGKVTDEKFKAYFEKVYLNSDF